MAMRRRSGFTLLELLIAIAVMIIAVAAATTLMMASVRLTRDVQGNAEAAERARTVMAELMDNTSRVMGAANGLRVKHPGVGVETDSPMFGYDGTTGAGTNVGAAISDGTLNADGGTAYPGGAHSDDLWLVVPTRGVFGDPFSDAGTDVGAKSPLLNSAGSGATLQVASIASLTSFKFLMVSTQLNCALPVMPVLSPPSLPCDMGALISPTLPLTNPIAYAENSTGSFWPDGNSFHPSDEVMGVNLVHYYIAKNKADLNHPALFRTTGTLTDDGKGRPFLNSATASDTMVVMPDIDDLQIAWGTDSATLPTNNVATYTWQNGFSPVYFVGTARTVTLKAIRLTVVARSHQILLREGSINVKALPIQSENHNATNDPGAYWTTPDGFDRVVLTRVMPLPNMSPWNL